MSGLRAQTLSRSLARRPARAGERTTRGGKPEIAGRELFLGDRAWQRSRFDDLPALLLKIVALLGITNAPVVVSQCKVQGTIGRLQLDCCLEEINRILGPACLFQGLGQTKN